MSTMTATKTVPVTHAEIERLCLALSVAADIYRQNARLISRYDEPVADPLFIKLTTQARDADRLRERLEAL